MPAKISQQVLKQVDKNFISFFNANKEYYKNPSAFLGKPKLPKYKDKISGRNILIYTNQAISVLSDNQIKLSKTNIVVNTKIKNILLIL